MLDDELDEDSEGERWRRFLALPLSLVLSSGEGLAATLVQQQA